MSDTLIVFASSFVSVFALGFQSLNVNQQRKIWASLTSVVICTGSLFIFQKLPTAGVLPILAYYLGCNLGILASMALHPRLKAWWDRPRRNPDVPPRRNPPAPRICECGRSLGEKCPRLLCARTTDEHADVISSTRLH